MPTTYNGIGTHYYGKKNVQSRLGACQQCGRQVELTSYDTRLWFVIIFIPVIPLGRKRILDQCPACSRHYIVELQKWETSKQLEISGALEKYRSNPSPDSAIETHQTLVNYHQTTEAAEFRQMMRTKYNDNAKVHAYLGAVLEQLGEFDEATECFNRAIELRPDMPEARVGVAQGLIRAKRFDDARQKLDFMEKPGASQLYSLEPLETLALALQAESRHEEALQLFAKLLEEIPALKEHTGFRKNVERSEKALRRKASVLPKRAFSWKRLFSGDPTAPSAGTQLSWRHLMWAGAVAAVVLFFAVIQNEYTRRHRTLHIVNGLAQPALVNIRGVGEVKVGRGKSELTLPEGHHHASISGPVAEDFDFDLRTSFFDRWASDPVWVLNVGGAAVISVSRVTYSKNPPPPGFSYHFGQPLEYFPDVTHPFRDLPDSLRMKSHESRTLTQVEVFPGDAIALFQHFLGKSQWSDALRLAETRLRYEPNNDPLLFSYAAAASSHQQLERAEKFLRAGMTNRPVRINWHRSFQNLKKDRRRDAQLAAEYDALLQAEPDNSALLYLRGRLSPTRDESRRYFERAAAADPKNPFPPYAQGYDQLIRGDWRAARPLLQKARDLAPDDLTIAHFHRLTRFALGEYDTLEQECRDALKRAPLSVPDTARLCELLVAEGKSAAAMETVATFERAATSRYGEEAREMIAILRCNVLYQTGDFAGLEKSVGSSRAEDARLARFHSLIEQGRVADALATKIADEAKAANDKGLLELCVALAWTLQNNAAEARTWIERAAKALEDGDADSAAAAEMLRRNTPPTSVEVESLVLQPQHKALLLACLAHRHPARQSELGGLARRLNVERDFPYHLLQRATAVAQ